MICKTADKSTRNQARRRIGGIRRESTTAAPPWPTVSSEESKLIVVLDFLMPLLARALVPLFFLGIAGSAVVCVVTTLLDVQEFTSDDETQPVHDGGLV